MNTSERTLRPTAVEQMKQNIELAGCVGTGTTVRVDSEDLSVLIADYQHLSKGFEDARIES